MENSRCYSYPKVWFLPSVSHLALRLCGTKRLSGEENKEIIESKKGAELIIAFSLLLVVALVSSLL